MRELCLARLCEFETLHVELLQKVEFVWEEHALLLHHQLQVAKDLLFTGRGQYDALDVWDSLLRLLEDGFTDARPVD